MDKSETKTVYSYDSAGLLIGTHMLDYTDRSPVSDRWQIPGNMTDTEPPAAKDGYDRYWTGTAWTYKEIPVDTEDNKANIPTTTGTTATLRERVAYLEDALNYVMMGGM